VLGDKQRTIDKTVAYCANDTAEDTITFKSVLMEAKGAAKHAPEQGHDDLRDEPAVQANVTKSARGRDTGRALCSLGGRCAHPGSQYLQESIKRIDHGAQ
jgi:hypothetical protein